MRVELRGGSSVLARADGPPPRPPLITGVAQSCDEPRTRNFSCRVTGGCMRNLPPRLPAQQQLAADEQLARLRDEYGGGGASFSWRWLVLVLGAGLAVFAVVVSTLLPASYLR